MTIEELYEWAKAQNCTDYVINIECYDKGIYKTDVYVNESILEKRSYDVVIKVRE
nr:MAG TPA: hypothetical protein [Caudoviricetes sp.]